MSFVETPYGRLEIVSFRLFTERLRRTAVDMNEVEYQARSAAGIVDRWRLYLREVSRVYSESDILLDSIYRRVSYQMLPSSTRRALDGPLHNYLPAVDFMSADYSERGGLPDHLVWLSNNSFMVANPRDFEVYTRGSRVALCVLRPDINRIHTLEIPHHLIRDLPSEERTESPSHRDYTVPTFPEMRFIDPEPTEDPNVTWPMEAT